MDSNKLVPRYRRKISCTFRYSNMYNINCHEKVLLQKRLRICYSMVINCMEEL